MREFFDFIERLEAVFDDSFVGDLIGGVALFAMLIAGLSYGGHP